MSRHGNCYTISRLAKKKGEKTIKMFVSLFNGAFVVFFNAKVILVELH